MTSQPQPTQHKFIRFFKQSTFLLGMVVMALSACTHSKDNAKNKPVIVKDTTALGKKIEAISLKIGEDPKNAVLYNERAQLHLQRKDIANAMIDMNKATSLDSTKADLFVTLADVHFMSGNSAKSKAALDKCLSLDPNNLKALEKMAELYFYVQQYEKSIAYLDRILKIDIHNPKAYFMKGMNFKEKGDTTRAIGSFQTSIEQDKDNYDAYQQLGILYTLQNNPLGLQYFEGALRINPRSEEALYGRGMFYQEVKHDYDKAIIDYTNILQLNPKDARASFALGFIHFQYLKVYSEALKHYTNAINAEPTWPEAVYNRGLCYETMGNITAAKGDYIMAIKLRPDYVLARNGLSRVK
jgi:tetratricopeptide (TPR) repeat protein